MNWAKIPKLAIIVLVGTFSIVGSFVAVNDASAKKDQEENFKDNFNLESCTWSSTGSNDFFILEPGYQLVLSGREDGALVHLTITVLDETQTIQGIPTRVIEERETSNGELVEVSRNFFSICNETKDVFYFGEDVDMYENGQVINHEGSWIHGMDGASAGLMMSGNPEMDFAYYQEIAPKIALDRAEIESLNEKIKTPIGTFYDSLEIFETTPLEPKAKDYKFYSKDVGLIQSNSLKLIGYGSV